MKKINKNILKNIKNHIVLIFFILTYLYGMTNYGINIFLNKNILITFFIWMISFYLYYRYNNKKYLLIPIIFLIINEINYICTSNELYDGGNRTALFYDIGVQHFIKSRSGTENFTEAVYLDEFSNTLPLEKAKKINPLDAQKRRFDEVFKVLKIDNLTKNEYKNITLIDFGCGNGEFLQYCSDKGVNAIGFTISKEQANYVKKKGLQCNVGNYKNLNKNLINKADIITFLGSLEHLAYGIPCHKNTLHRQNNNWLNIISHCKKYFKKDSKYRKLYFAVLHLNPKYCNTLAMYLLERAYGGSYNYTTKGSRLHDIVEKNGFKILYEKDMTYHYYLSSVLDENHFGNPNKLTLERALLALPAAIFVNPQILMILLYSHYGIWMWQFDGKIHKYGQKNISYEENISKRPVTLWWAVTQLI